MKNHSLLILVCALLIYADLSFASDLGTIGLIDTPTARMRPDGEFAATISKQPSVDIYSFNYQAMPWLEASFRYALLGFTYDRSYELKARLLREGQYLPELAVGVRDLLGTGVFGSEYLVANKAFGPLDISLGLGWGRFAGRAAFDNPLTKVSDRFAVRDFNVGRGGTVSFDSFFSGPEVGVFGGVAYDLPEFDLKLVAEYNSDTYQRERSRGTVEDPSPISFGVEWEPIPNITLAASRQFGEEWGLRISSRLDSTLLPERYEPPVYFSANDLARFEINDPASFAADFNDLDLSSWYTRLSYDMQKWGISLLEVSRSPDSTEVSLVISNNSYAMSADALNVALDMAQTHLPESYTSLNLVMNEDGIQPITLNLYRQRGAENWTGLGSSVNLLPGREVQDSFYTEPSDLGKVALGLGLGARFSIFDPDNPLRHQFLLRLNAIADIGMGWKVRSSYVQDIDNNFDEITRPSDSILPHVRSDVVRYMQEGESGLEALYVERKDNLSSDVFYRLYGGVLEEMYSGVGGEVLYQPFRSRLAYGLSANWVKQRDYDKSFNHLDYDVVTAFASLYWATPFYNYDVAVHVGRYLAKDVGATFEIQRTFDNGWMVGAWATLTDVPFDEFGEGSFDKGLYFRIPFQNLLGVNTRASEFLAIRSIQRDGGQFLEGFSGTLWHDLRTTRYDAIYNNRDRILP